MQFALRLRAVPTKVSVMRQALSAWLTSHAWPSEDRDVLVTVVGEACTNAVLHAYPDDGEGDVEGDVEVTARIEAVGERRRVQLRVRDWGRWHPQLEDGERHLGLALIRHLVDRLDVQSRADGTELRVVSGPVPRAGRV